MTQVNGKEDSFKAKELLDKYKNVTTEGELVEAKGTFNKFLSALDARDRAHRHAQQQQKQLKASQPLSKSGRRLKQSI